MVVLALSDIGAGGWENVAGIGNGLKQASGMAVNQRRLRQKSILLSLIKPGFTLTKGTTAVSTHLKNFTENEGDSLDSGTRARETLSHHPPLGRADPLCSGYERLLSFPTITSQR